MLSRPAAFAAMIFLTLVGYYWWQLMAINHGHFAYALDDAYIHMAIARHFVQDHVWGVTTYESSGASSSLLYTLLIAVLDFVFGVREAWPFVLNALSAFALLLILGRLWRRSGVAEPIQWVLFGLVLVLVPLASQVFSGMEVILQCAIAVLLVSWVFFDGRRRSTFVIALAAFFATAIRYEMVFLVIAIALVLCFERRWVVASAICLAGSVPPLIYGVLSTANGGFFFPNTLLLKGNHLPLASLDWLNGHAVIAATAIVVLGVLLFIVARSLSRRGHTNVATPSNGVWHYASVFAITLSLHLTFSIISYPSQFQRHHSYLIILGIVLVGAASDAVARRYAKERLRIYAGVAISAILLTLPFLNESAMWLEKTAMGAKNIYDQHVQMAQLIQHTHATAFVNDIGAVSYYTNNRIVDLVGLGSNGIARIRLERMSGSATDSAVINYAESRGVTLATIYDPKFFGFHPPGTWKEIGALHIANNFTAGQSTVLIYATTAAAVATLQESLRLFDRASFPNTRLDIY